MFLGGMAAVLGSFAAPREAEALTEQPSAPDRPTLLANLRLFNGIDRRLQEGLNILVSGNKIEALPRAGETVSDARVVDCGGRLVMPGLIDAHWHSTLCGITQLEAMTADIGYVNLVAARVAEHTLMRGFTTVRDASGPAFALKQAIDRGIVNGPRIYPSGAMISQTSGHGDFRMRYEIPKGETTPLSHFEIVGAAVIGDGVPEVLRRVREQLMLGATQIKLAGGGGVASAYDPLDSIQYTESELGAAVQAAADWGTYVMIHTYTPAAIQRAIRAGVKSIEHGQLADEETAKMMADEGIWWSLQPFLADGDANMHADPQARGLQQEVAAGTIRAYELSKKYKVKTAWGTDILFSPRNLPGHARQLAKLAPRLYDPLEILSIATGINGELVGLCGPRNSYDGAVGIIAPGALADILVADGDPTRSLDFLTDPEANLRLIMKDGRIYKDTLR
jgi:imidazolonepropionase-like amidohydrolase